MADDYSRAARLSRARAIAQNGAIALNKNFPMRKVERSALVPFHPSQIYDLVNDIEAYPTFLPWCAAAEVAERTPASVRASLEIRKGPIHHRFTTVNTLRPTDRIDMALLEGPFRHLQGHWTFTAIGDKGCEVRLNLEYVFANRLLETVLGPMFAEITQTLVAAFCDQARKRYAHT